MNIYQLILSVFLFLELNTYSQNLVLNPSFEENTKRSENCPTLFSLNGVTNWKQATKNGSVDYFTNGQNCFRKDNYLLSRTGSHHIGLVVYFRKRNWRYREYLEGKLSSSLVKGRKYKIEFYTALENIDGLAYSGLGIYLSEEEIYKKKPNLNKLESCIYSEKIITEQERWVKVSGVYEAKGGELFLTLGNFQKLKSLKRKYIGKGLLTSYYYIDDVSIIEITKEFKELRKDSLISIENTNISVLPSINDSIRLSSIQFKTNSYNLIDSTTNELDVLIDYLFLNPFLKIEISGHTDSIGSVKYNYKLSLNRANEIEKYLIEKGISVNRIKVIGYGAAIPIADNNSEIGRKQNRRIEIVITDVFNLENKEKLKTVEKPIKKRAHLGG